MARTSEDKRDEILKAAIELVLEKGIADITMADVAARAEVSKGLVTYHFQTKETLFTQAWQQALRRLSDEVTEAVGDIEGTARLEGIYRASFRREEKEGLPWGFWLEYWALAARSPSLRNHHNEMVASMRESITRYLRAGMLAGDIRQDINPSIIAVIYHSLIYGLAVGVQLDAGEMTNAKAYEAGQAFLALLRPPSVSRQE